MMIMRASLCIRYKAWVEIGSEGEIQNSGFLPTWPTSQFLLYITPF